MKIYLAVSTYGDIIAKALTVSDLLEKVSYDDPLEAPSLLTYYEAVEGKYTPPSKDATLVFPERK